jgi:hypothetical protein
MGLAKSLVANLGYHKPRFGSIIKYRRPDLIEGTDSSSKQEREAGFSELNSKTLEEWRALAGCFFLSVVYVKRPNFIPSSQSNTDKSCQNLYILQENRATAIHTSSQRML